MAIKISGVTIIDDSRNIVSGAAATFTSNVTIGGTLTYEDVTNIDSVGVITAREGIKIPFDNKFLLLGESNDLSLSHTAGHSYIADTGTGDLRITGSVIRIQNAIQNKDIAVFNQNTSVDLYFNDNLKFKTTNTGVEVIHAGGGVLDVTTINATDGDFAGIVTAQGFVGGGINTNAVSIFKDLQVLGGINISGVATANAFSGDGSNLTNLPVSSFFTNTDVGIHTLAKVGIGTTNPIAQLDVNVGSSVTALNIEGSEGQLFSVTNNLSSGSIFAVNDITGLPSIDVNADGTIQLAPRGAGELVGIGTTVPTSKLHLVGDALVTGVGTFASSINVADSIIHQGDTDTKIDFANNQIEFTANNRLRIDLNANNYNYLYGSQLIEADSTHPKAGSATYVARFRDTTGDDTVVHFHNTNVKNTAIEWNAHGNTSAAGNLIFRDLNTAKTEYARFTGTGNFNIAKDFSVAGVSTFSDDVNLSNDKKVKFGTMGFQIYQNTSSSNNAIIQQSAAGQFLRLITNGGQLSVEADYVQFRNSANSSTTAQFDADGATNLFHNSNLKFFTKTDGAGVTGILTATSIKTPKYDGDADRNIIMGCCAGIAITDTVTDACRNVIIGCSAGRKICCSEDAVIIGTCAGHELTNASANVLIGQFAACKMCCGFNNVVIGKRAGAGLTGRTSCADISRGANANIFLGAYAGFCMRRECNVVIGPEAGRYNDSGQFNTWIGPGAGRGPSASAATNCGYANVFLGSGAGSGARGGQYNVVIGRNVGSSISTGGNHIFIGCGAGVSQISGFNNIFMGNLAGACVTIGTQSIFMGQQTGRKNISGGLKIAIGDNAGEEGMGATSNGGIAIGYCSQRCSTCGSGNVALGNAAGFRLTCGQNTFLGQSTGVNATAAHGNTFVGNYVGGCFTTGCRNTFIGCHAGMGHTVGTFNVMLGACSGPRTCGAVGECNIFIGGYTASAMCCGLANVLIGTHAGQCLRNAYCNVFLGRKSGLGVTSGCFNFYVGNHAGPSTCGASGSDNIGLGRDAMRNSTGGASCNIALGPYAGNDITGNYNVILGCGAALDSTSLNHGIIIGCEASPKSTGDYTLSIGVRAGRCNTTGIRNINLGFCAGHGITTGESNISIGRKAGAQDCGASGEGNASIGHRSGCNLTSGNNNNFLGTYAGNNITSGDSNIAIGYDVALPSATGDAQLAIGCGSNRWIAGDSSYKVTLAGIVTATAGGAVCANSTTLKAYAVDTDIFSITRSDHASSKLFRIFQDSSSGGGAGGAHINTFNRNLMITASTSAATDSGVYLRTTGEFGVGTNNPTSKVHVVANGGDAAFKVGTALTVTGAGQAVFSGVTTFTGNNSPGGRGAIHLPYNCMLVLGDTYIRGAIYNSGAQLVFQALNTYKFRVWDGGGMQDWMNVHGPGGSVSIGGCHAGVSGSTNRTHLFNTSPHKITMCSSVPDSATLTKRFELDSYGFNFTGITTVTGNLNVTGIATATKFDGAVQCNIVMGCGAGIAITAGCSVCSNVLIGRCAGKSVESSSRNVIIGCGAGTCLNDGSGGNTFIGDQAGHYMGRCGCATNTGNVFLGWGAGKSVVNSCHAVAIGYQAAHGVANSKMFASHTINIGCRAGCKMEGGHSIINIGRMAGASNSGGTFNVNIGYQAGFNNLTGGNNFYGGYLAGFCNKTGGSNIAIGQNAFKCGTSGTTNIFMLNATGCNANGHSNIALGYIAFRCNSSGSHNIALGACAMRGCDTPANGTGCCNIFIGRASGCYISSGNRNTVIGATAGYAITTGSKNVILGIDAGFNITSGSCNVVIGPSANVPSGCSGTMTIACGTMNWITGFNDGSVTINYANANANGLLRISRSSAGSAQLRFDTAAANTASLDVSNSDGNELRVRVGSTEHTRFKSDGSFCTGNINTTGVVTATHFYGDGSNLTGISGGGGISTTFFASSAAGIHTLSKVGIGTAIPEAQLDVNVGSGVTALNISGSEGQLFSVTNNLTSGSIFEVNDVSGMPSIDVNADGTIQLAPHGTGELVGIGTTVPTSKLHVVGDTLTTGFSTFRNKIQIKPLTAQTTCLTVGCNDAVKLTYTNANQSYLQSSAAFLSIANNNVIIQRADTNCTMATFRAGAENSFTWNYVKRLSTSSIGATVFGQLDTTDLNVSGVSTFSDDIKLPDDKRIRFGVKNATPNGELTIHHSSSDVNFITSPTSRTLQILGDGGLLVRGGGNQNIAYFRQSSIQLYHQQTLTVETTSEGIKVGTGVTIERNGQATFVGVVTFGSSSTTIDGNSDTINVGTALTIGHTQGLQFHTQNLHSTGFEVNNINATGIITATNFTKTDGTPIASTDIAINTLSSSSATGGGSASFNGTAYRFTLSEPPDTSVYQLFVSINGVIQKPNAGSSQPSEGFAIDGNDIIFGSPPPAGSPFFIQTFKTVGISSIPPQAQVSTTSAAKSVKNVTTSTSAPTNSNGVDGDLWFTYIA